MNRHTHGPRTRFHQFVRTRCLRGTGRWGAPQCYLGLDVPRERNPYSPVGSATPGTHSSTPGSSFGLSPAIDGAVRSAFVVVCPTPDQWSERQTRVIPTLRSGGEECEGLRACGRVDQSAPPQVSAMLLHLFVPIRINQMINQLLTLWTTESFHAQPKQMRNSTASNAIERSQARYRYDNRTKRLRPITLLWRNFGHKNLEPGNR